MQKDIKNLKGRVLKISSDLPGDYIELIIEIYPEYNSDYWKNRIRNVKSLTVADEQITRILESVSENYQLMKKSLKKANRPSKASCVEC